MRIFRLPKRNGKFRTIYEPNEVEKKALLELLPGIVALCRKECPPGVVHGFMPGRAPVTNAVAHIGYEFTASFDLLDFFDSVSWRHLHTLLEDKVLDKVLVDGSPRQGLPTSPAVANLAAAAMDREILSLIAGRDIVYTRYADDLTFSTSEREDLPWLKHEITHLVKRHHFQLNPKKTKAQWSRAGRRKITGVCASDQGIHPTREAKRKYRAAVHQGRRASAAGLAEWLKLRPPREACAELEQKVAQAQRQLAALKASRTPARKPAHRHLRVFSPPGGA